MLHKMLHTNTLLAEAQNAPPAGGANLGEVFIAVAISLAVTAPTIWVLWREINDKPNPVGRLADWISSKDGFPRWVGLPSYLGVLALLTAGFGVWWDVALHMQNGRDEGPLANPSHYPIFLAILAFFNIGILSMALTKAPFPRRTLEIIPGLRAPMGALAITGAGAIALVGFPADDLWHRLFGQDVTEWGPTHVMMIGGAVTVGLGITLLQAEARQVGGDGGGGWRARITSALALSLCITPFAFLMEFDLGVPQFPLATQFIIAAFLAGWVFIAVRAYFGPGGALLAWGFYAIAHIFLFVTTWALPGVLTARFLLFLPAAIIVELVALVVSPRRGATFWVLSGVLVGTVGTTAEWLWTKVFMPLPQPAPASALPLMIGISLVAAIGGALLGLWHVRMLQATAAPIDVTPDTFVEARYDSYWQRHGTGLVGFGLFVALMAVFVPQDTIEFAAEVDLDYADGATAETCGTAEECRATVTVTVQPDDVADDALWFYALAWQGRHRGAPGDLPTDPITGAPGIMRVEMVPTGTPGEYRSADPLPLYGSWKTLVRLHTAPTNMGALPLYAPDDPAIAADKGRRILVQDGQIVDSMSEPGFLQREIKDDVPSWLWNTAYAIVGLMWAALVAFYGWCYAAAAGRGRKEDTETTDTPRVSTPSGV